jgi:muramidase (phage lysozyme)
MARISANEAGGVTVLAFLDTLKWCELGPALIAESDEGYNVLVGSKPGDVHTFPSYADHPQIFVAFPYRDRTTNVMRVVTSSAAGAYQILAKTFDVLAEQHGFRDFTPETQDLAAVALVAGRGALELVQNGQIEAAIAKCNKEWASLPGSPYGQPTHSMIDVLNYYHAALQKYVRPDFSNVESGVSTTA